MVVAPPAIGKQPIVPDSMESGREHVDKKAADELVVSQGHDLVPGGPLGAVVLPFECDAGVVEPDQPAVGDGDPVGGAKMRWVGGDGDQGLGGGLEQDAIDAGLVVIGDVGDRRRQGG